MRCQRSSGAAVGYHRWSCPAEPQPHGGRRAPLGTWAGGQVVVDILALVGVERVERIDAEHLLDLVVGHGWSPVRPRPETMS